MVNQDKLSKFGDLCVQGLSNGKFIKLSLGNYCGTDTELKNIYVKRVDIRSIQMLSFTYRYKRRDITKNYPVDEGVEKVLTFLKSDFRIATLFTAEKEIIIEFDRKGKSILREKEKARKPEDFMFNHDRPKVRLISTDVPYLSDLGITDTKGHVFKSAQDKYRQINHYIDLLAPVIKGFSGGQIRRVVDMGSGKGYLTFALYDFLNNVLHENVRVSGVEFRDDLVNLCNQIAAKAGFDKLDFSQGTIEQYELDSTDILIALHACDTATDDAIFKGIRAGAKVIAVAPCCHKQIRKELSQSQKSNDLTFLTKYGIFLERQAEMITDSIRALVLEYFGYKTKVLEFVSDIHTPKNIMIIGIQSTRPISTERQEAILSQLTHAKSYFGISYHHLERLLGLDC